MCLEVLDLNEDKRKRGNNIPKLIMLVGLPGAGNDPAPNR